MDANGSNQINLTVGTDFACSPASSPGGGASPGALNRISFVTDRDGNDEIYTMNLDGSDPVRVTSHDSDDFSSSWMSDGTRLIFDTDRNGHWDIYSIAVSGGNAVRLTTSSANDRFPEWRPSGQAAPVGLAPGAPGATRHAGGAAGTQRAAGAAHSCSRQEGGWTLGELVAS
jgi:TolB protein